MELQKSGEDYLETILLLHNRTGYVRAVDIATELGYSKPSVSKAMGILKASGYITVSDDGQIRLTKTGQKRASDVYDRHQTLKSFFMDILGVNEITAEGDACLIEHMLSEETYLRLKGFTAKFSENSAEKI